MLQLADLRLRGRDGPLPARLYWPQPVADADLRPLLVFFPALDDTSRGVRHREELSRRLCTEAGIVVLAALHRPVRHRSECSATQDAVTVTQWAVDHAHNIGVDADRVLVGGEGFGATLAAAVAVHARDNGWPPIRRQLLIDPASQTSARLATSGAGIAPATVVTTAPHDGGPSDGAVSPLVAALLRSIQMVGDGGR